MSLPKKDRNKEILKKRLKNPKNWTWAKLGEHYGAHRTTLQKMAARELAKMRG